MLAISLVVQWLEEIKPTIICLDSSSSLATLQNSQLKHKTDTPSTLQSSDVCRWLADKKAKEAKRYMNSDLVTDLSITEVRNIVKQRIRERWQKQ